MKMLKSLLVGGAIALTLATGVVQSDEREFGEIQKVLKEQERAFALSGKGGGELMIGGDVRLEYKSLTESINGNNLRGSGSPFIGGERVPNILYQIEAKLHLDYTTENTWTNIKLEFDNPAGIESGTSNSIKLETALLGMTIMEEGASRLDIEFGRDEGYHMFDSQIQFDSLFDGIYLKYSNVFEGLCDFYVHGGVILVDDVVDNYAWLSEFGLMDIYNTGLYAKYSYINWRQKGVDRNGEKDYVKYKYRNSQVIAGYVFKPEMLRTEANLYGAWLVNHEAKKRTISNDKKENSAWYAGIKLGEVEKAGDWSAKVEYQYVEAQAVPGFDMSGIGIGNVDNNTFYDAATVGTARGDCNFKGYQIEMLFALTDNVYMGMDWEATNAAEKDIGGRHSYKKFELEAIYVF